MSRIWGNAQIRRAGVFLAFVLYERLYSGKGKNTLQKNAGFQGLVSNIQ